MKFFLPKQKIFFDLLRDINEQLKKMAELFSEFTAEFKNFDEYSKKAKEIEHAADTKTHEIINKLNSTFVTPLDREDIHHLAIELDDIIDLIENVIHNIAIYQISEKKEAMDDFAKLISEASHCLNDLIDHLEKQKDSASLNESIIKIHSLEDQGDLIFQKAMISLFKEEQNAVDIIKWKDLLEDMENIMDRYQEISDTMHAIIVKSS